MGIFPATAVERKGDQQQGKWKTCEQVKQHPRAANDSQKELKRQMFSMKMETRCIKTYGNQLNCS